MHLTVSREPELVAVTVSGRFDAHRVDEFERSVVALVDDTRPHVYVDLSEVESMDAAAVEALVRTREAALAHSGTMTIVEVSDAVRTVLAQTRHEGDFRVSRSPQRLRA